MSSVNDRWAWPSCYNRYTIITAIQIRESASLQSTLGHRVMLKYGRVFTYRDWPSRSRFDRKKREKYAGVWSVFKVRSFRVFQIYICPCFAAKSTHGHRVMLKYGRVFTYRDWPSRSSFDRKRREKYVGVRNVFEAMLFRVFQIYICPCFAAKPPHTHTHAPKGYKKSSCFPNWAGCRAPMRSKFGIVL